MSQEFKAGDHVAWGKAEDRTWGRIKRKLTEPYKIKSFEVPASHDNPYHLVETDRTGAEAAHRPDELRKVN
ncbi:MAG: DUF2945 domain-containing protein, partial [Chloroflexota bacterium]|nr:DUF2945 domain-containing protein [Chloroflexota bacterium]